MKEQIKAPEKNTTKQRRGSQHIRCTVQNTGNQDAHELVEYGHKIEENVKAMKSEIKENVQGTNSDRKETGTQINGLDQKEEITFNQNRMKKQEFNKMRRGLGTSGTTLSLPHLNQRGARRRKGRARN